MDIIPKHEYIRRVLDAYRQTPGISGVVRPNDRRLAAALYHRRVPPLIVENALILAGARRIIRPPDSPPLQPVRSLFYLLPVIDEVFQLQISQDYFRYFQFKVDRFLNR